MQINDWLKILTDIAQLLLKLITSQTSISLAVVGPKTKCLLTLLFLSLSVYNLCCCDGDTSQTVQADKRGSARSLFFVTPLLLLLGGWPIVRYPICCIQHNYTPAAMSIVFVIIDCTSSTASERAEHCFVHNGFDTLTKAAQHTLPSITALCHFVFTDGDTTLATR